MSELPVRASLRAFVVTLLAMGAPRGLAAQRLAEMPATWASHSPLGIGRDQPPLVKSRDYRWEGTVLGGVIVGASGFLLGSLFCADPAANGIPKSCGGAEVGIGAAGLVVGAGVGYLLGGSIPKHRPVTTQ